MGIIILLTIVCCVLYRSGGIGKPFDTKFRDLGCPTAQTLALIVLGFHNPLALFFSFGITFGALTTYWDFINEEDNFWLHGLFVGLAAFPVAIVTGHWWMFIVRALIIAIWSGVWSMIWKWDDAEEGGRLLPLIPTLYIIV